MSLTRYAIINGEDVVNVIDYEEPPGNPPPSFPDGYIAVQSDTAGPGWKYIDAQFVPPPSPPGPPIPPGE